MPYIKRERRVKFQILNTPKDAGELNYALTRLIIQYVELHGLRYQTINDVIGALTSCTAEFQRRVVAPYEDRKIDENGDLPWPSGA